MRMPCQNRGAANETRGSFDFFLLAAGFVDGVPAGDWVASGSRVFVSD